MKGDERAPNLQVSTAQQLQALTTYLPGLMDVIRQQIGPTERALLHSQQQVAPQQADVQNRILQTYLPQQAGLQAELFKQLSPVYSQAQAANELANVQGPGGQTVREIQKLEKEISPEYFTQREAVSNKLLDLLQNPISGSESAAIERANLSNQLGSGNFNVPNNSQQLSSAMNFANAGRDRLAQALNLATNAMPGLKSNTDVFNQATGRQTTPAQNQLQLQSPNLQNLGQSTFGAAGQFLGQIGQQQQSEQNINAQRRTLSDQMLTPIQSVCCFIFMEAYHGQMPWYVRSYRDLIYSVEPRIAKGYKRMAKILVPLMRRYPKVRNLVWRQMVLPLTLYGMWYFRVFNGGLAYVNYKRFWFNVWRILGI